MAHRSTTSVVVLNDFKITSLPIIPTAYIGRIDPMVWKEFTDQCQTRINQTFAQNNDLNGAPSKRRCLQISYWVCAPFVFIFGYLGYYCLVLSASLSTVLLAFGAILAIAGFACFVGAVVTATKCGSMMKEYRFACQQDLNGAFNFMNQRYNNMIYFSTARSTHRNNGKVQLGITVVLRAQNITINMANNGTATIIQQQGIMPVQVQGVPVQLANGQIVYQVAQPQGAAQQVIPIQHQQPMVHPVPMQQVVVPIQQQQGGVPQYQAPAPQYQPPNMNANAPPPAYGAAPGGGEGGEGGNNNNINPNGGTTGGPEQYQ